MNPVPTIPGVANLLRNVFDPEAGFNIIDMGLVYGIAVDEKAITVTLTFSTPVCPLGEMIKQDIRDQLKNIPGERDIQLQLVFDPAWSPVMLSPLARSMM